MNRITKARLVAQTIIDSQWSENEVVDLLKSCSFPATVGLEESCQRLLARFPSPPPRSLLETYLLKEFSPLLSKISPLLLNRLWKQSRTRPSSMRAGLAVTRTWTLPQINSIRELAALVETPIRWLDWLSAQHRQHYRISAVRKKSTGIRILEAPKYRLKTVQRRLLSELLCCVPCHTSAHGFVVGRSALSYVQAHVGKPFVMCMDLQDFFPTIDAARIFGLFRSLGYPYDVVQALTNLCTCSTTPATLFELTNGIANRVEQNRILSLYHRKHLPQGAPTSPALANLLAYRLDCRLDGLSVAADIVYSRYADDLLFSGGTAFARQAVPFSNQVAAIALEEGFRVHHRKTRRMRKSTRQSAAGIVINQSTNLRRTELDQLKAILFNCARQGPDTQNRDRHPQFREHLMGRINWVNQVNPQRGARLRMMFEKIAWSK